MECRERESMTESNGHNAVPRDMLTVRDLSCVTGLSERIIQRLISIQVIEPDECAPEPCFRAEAVVRVRKIRRLHVELGVSWSSMPLVLDLIEELQRLRGHT